MQQVRMAGGSCTNGFGTERPLWQTGCLLLHSLPVLLVRGCKLSCAAAVCIGFLFCSAVSTAFAEHPVSESADVQHHAGKDASRKVWNVILVAGGGEEENHHILAYTAFALGTMHLINTSPIILMDGSRTEVIWNRLASQQSGRLRFLKDGFYTFNYGLVDRNLVTAQIVRRVREKGDVDMVIAMGIWAGIEMASANLGIPVIIMNCNDALASGIVKGAEFSGIPNIHAECEPDRTGRMLSSFYANFPVDKMGVIFDDTPEGKRLGGLENFRAAARALGIELVESHAPFLLMTQDWKAVRMRSSVEELLSKGVRAIMFLTTGSLPSKMSFVLAPIGNRPVPTFSMKGKTDVRHGVLMGMMYEDYVTLGNFEAGVIKAVLDGKKPGDINQFCAPKSGIVVNMEVALRIGWMPPLEVLLSIDSVCRHSGDIDF